MRDDAEIVADAQVLKMAVERQILRHQQASLGLVAELRLLLDRIERSLKNGAIPNVSCTALVTDLFNRIGQYEALIDVGNSLLEMTS